MQNLKLLLIDSSEKKIVSEEERQFLVKGQWRLHVAPYHGSLPLNYSDASWDAVIWHLEKGGNLKAALEEAYRLVAAEGMVLLTAVLHAREKAKIIRMAKALSSTSEMITLADKSQLLRLQKPAAPLDIKHDPIALQMISAMNRANDIQLPHSNNVIDNNIEDSIQNGIEGDNFNHYAIPGIPPNIDEGYLGAVELLHETHGIIGWVFDAAFPNNIVTIGVYLNNHLVGTTYSVNHRADISELIKHFVTPGFHLKWQHMRVPLNIRQSETSKLCNFIFKIEGTNWQLRNISNQWPTIKEWLDWVGPDQPEPMSESQKQAVIENLLNKERTDIDISVEVKAIAFYLPQFHPIPENDEWWGPGFTEWTNVAQAKPLFPGHYQPHIPGELGFYDLRLPEVREAQAKLAREYGIYGFCYYYYWFAGRKILERPLQEVLESGKPDFPFCICWANENWSRRWDGSENDLLLKQEHSPENDAKFIHDVIPFLHDKRYIRVDGKPILLVYRLSLLPHPKQTAAIWRKICSDAGLGEIYLCAVASFGYTNPYVDGFDASVQFPPHDARVANSVNSMIKGLPQDYTGVVYDYEEVVFNELQREVSSHKIFRGVMCNWDNTARKNKAANIFLNSTPESYEIWLRGAVDYTHAYLPERERVLFINAWNEWAEGTHLEPDRKFGRRYLEATQRALQKKSGWQALLEYVNKGGPNTQDDLREIIKELGHHLRKYEMSLNYLTRIHKPMMREMKRRAVFVKSINTAILGIPLSLDGEGRIEQIGPTSAPISIANWILDRLHCVYMSGWALARNHTLNQHSLDYFVLERVSDKVSYYALSQARCQRKDVTAFMKETYTEKETAFCGFQVFLDMNNVEPGEYRLGLIHLGCKFNTMCSFSGVWTIV